ncbi:MAG TPA: Xaa-Pro peptidase family protein [Gemmatimonadaceae bacterium]|nr:Xaa-Pro peptidase family protein [Gemmatimonadaceae bacterium]
MADHRPRRVAALLEQLDRAHLDALLVTSLPNVRYLTGFSGSSGLLLVSRREVLFLSDFRYETQAAEQVGDLARISIQPQSLWTGLWQLLPAVAGIDVIGFESGALLHRDFQRLLESGARWQWRPTSELVESLRERKDADEVEAVRRAGEIATSALDRTLGALHVGMTELEVAGTLEKALRDAGSEGFPFPTIVASGERTALPHARSSSRPVAAGELVLLDFGAEAGGYCADVTRTVVLGRATAEQREVYEVVQGAQAAALAGVRAGMTGRDADGLARGYIERGGYGERFGHGLGHGLGLEVHEAPRLSRTADAPLPTGAVVTIEPGIYLPGWGGVRIEDDVHLGADGPELLTHFTRDLMELA